MCTEMACPCQMLPYKENPYNSAGGPSMVNVVWGRLERVGCRVRPYGGINAWCHIGFCSDQELLPTGGGLRNYLLIYGIKTWIYFQPRLSTAIIRWGDSHCKEFIYFNVDCQLELEGESALHHERKWGKKKKKGEITGASSKCWF